LGARQRNFEGLNNQWVAGVVQVETHKIIAGREFQRGAVLSLRASRHENLAPRCFENDPAGVTGLKLRPLDE
jgi:hypothetical protein